MTLLVRDEEDILEQHLQYHFAQGVDEILVTDNRSVDRTPRILRRFERAGRLRVFEELADDYAQAKWVTRMARLAAEEHGADWVIHSDADEFWWPLRGDLAQTLARVPPETDILSVRRSNFPPRPPQEGSTFDRMIVREVSSLAITGGPLPPKIIHRAHPEAEIAQGNHAVDAPGLVSVDDQPALLVLHFPLRTYRQFENKIVKGGRAYERNKDLPAEVGATWRHLYLLYQRGELRDYWESTLKTTAELREGIIDGTLVRDTRLMHFLHRLPAKPPVQSVSKSPGATRRWLFRRFGER